MTTRNLAVRLAVVDGGKVKAELRDVGESGQRSLRRIEEASRPASRALLAVDGAAGQVRGSLEGLTGRLGPLGGALRGLGLAGLAAGAAMDGLPLPAAGPGDVLVFADAAYPCHCGFLTAKHAVPHLLHAHALRRKVIEEPYAGEWPLEVKFAFRFRTS